MMSLQDAQKKMFMCSINSAKDGLTWIDWMPIYCDSKMLIVIIEVYALELYFN